MRCCAPSCRKGERFHGDEIVGFKDAWDGVREGRTMPLTIDVMRGSLPRGGTVLGTKRGSPFDHPGGVDEVKRTFSDLGIDALIVVGGNGSLTVAHALAEEEGLPIVGVPKTIDNDVVGTDMTFGFHTAVQIATEAIDRLHTTAESHDRVMVVEVMGRHSGWIAAYAGIAGGASVVLIPEIPFDIEKVCVHLARRHEKGRYASIVVVAEGAEPIPGTIEVGERVYDKFGHVRLGGIADVIAREVGERTGFETRVVMLGHVQRGRHADGVRPGPVDAVRRRRHRPRPRAGVGADGRPAAAPRSSPARSPTPSGAPSRSTCRSTTASPRSSSREVSGEPGRRQAASRPVRRRGGRAAPSGSRAAVVVGGGGRWWSVVVAAGDRGGRRRDRRRGSRRRRGHGGGRRRRHREGRLRRLGVADEVVGRERAAVLRAGAVGPLLRRAVDADQHRLRRRGSRWP